MSLSARLLPLLFAASALPLSQVLFPGCATMINGPTEHVVVKSRPAGAQVFVNGHLIGSTPATAVVSRWGMHRVRIEMAGYKPLEIPLEKSYNQYASGNLFLGGIWIIVDALTGAIFELEVPAKYRSELSNDGPQDFQTAIFSQVTISTTLKPAPAARRIGQLERRSL